MNKIFLQFLWLYDLKILTKSKSSAKIEAESKIGSWNRLSRPLWASACFWTMLRSPEYLSPNPAKPEDAWTSPSPCMWTEENRWKTVAQTQINGFISTEKWNYWHNIGMGCSRGQVVSVLLLQIWPKSTILIVYKLLVKIKVNKKGCKCPFYKN